MRIFFNIKFDSKHFVKKGGNKLCQYNISKNWKKKEKRKKKIKKILKKEEKLLLTPIIKELNI